MDIERKIELICRPPTEEVVTIEDLRHLLETEEHPIAYNGWEPSGLPIWEQALFALTK